MLDRAAVERHVDTGVRIVKSAGAVVWLLLALALAVRLALVFESRGAGLRLDAVDYDAFGRSIARGDGFPESSLAASGGPTALRPPLYPGFLGLDPTA